MDPLNERALELFGELCDLPPDVQARRLAQIGHEERQLRLVLEELLEGDRLSDGGLAHPLQLESEHLAALATPLAEGGPLRLSPGQLRAEQDLMGRRLGPFTLLRCLGRGGMGVVLEAEQDHPRRRVALKVMRTGLGSDEALLRFRHEVEYLGRLQHPSIAQVYQAGTVELEGEAMPYFAMELVPEALALDQHVQAKRLDLRARVRLFAQVCEAVHHGHQRGIIHRDLKPSNVLIGPDGIPKVIDFGVARATDSDVTLTTQRTGTGELIGTLAYMSPEQCDADPGGLDLRSDVYSLGVILYELLCGRPPYALRGLTLVAAATMIREREPEPPGRIDRRLRGDLEAVILKAMEKDRRRRYPSASALAEDLARWMAGDPVTARTPGAWVRAMRWLARHPLASTTLACILVGSGLLASSLLGLRHLDRPAQTSLDATQRIGMLLSRTGAPLHVWDSGVERGLRHCELVAGEDGGVVVLAPSDLGRLPWNGEVCFFRTDDLQEPYWTSASAPIALLPSERPQAYGFYPAAVRVFDMLATSPGPEVAVAHCMTDFSPTCIRVYDLAGRVLFETWNDGAVTDLEWLSEPNRLLVCGLDSELRWDQRGVTMPDSIARYPAVVFALDLGHSRATPSTYLLRNGALQDPAVAWHRWLGPVEHLPPLEEVTPSFEPVPNEGASGRLRVRFSRNDGRVTGEVGLHIVLAADGTEVTRYPDDGWRRAQLEGALPDASVYRLLDCSELPYR